MIKKSVCLKDVMELNFDTVKALSSRTRIRILNEALANESTPTDLSKAVGRSKSTVSSHLEKLQEADLLEKEEVEGRRRVIYRPTDKTKAIINGRNRKVKFSILSSVSTAWIGAGLGLKAFRELSAPEPETGGGQLGTMALDKGTEAAGSSSDMMGSLGTEALLFVGLGFLSVSVAGLFYGFVFSRLGE